MMQTDGVNQERIKRKTKRIKINHFPLLGEKNNGRGALSFCAYITRLSQGRRDHKRNQPLEPQPHGVSPMAWEDKGWTGGEGGELEGGKLGEGTKEGDGVGR